MTNTTLYESQITDYDDIIEKDVSGDFDVITIIIIEPESDTRHTHTHTNLISQNSNTLTHISRPV